jgi:hypothetical protein
MPAKGFGEHIDFNIERSDNLKPAYKNTLPLAHMGARKVGLG